MDSTFNQIKTNNCACDIEEGSALLCNLHLDSALLSVLLLLKATISSLIYSTAGTCAQQQWQQFPGAGCLPVCCRWQCRVTEKTEQLEVEELLTAPLLQGILTITVCYYISDLSLPPIQGPFVLSLHSPQKMCPEGLDRGWRASWMCVYIKLQCVFILIRRERTLVTDSIMPKQTFFVFMTE